MGYQFGLIYSATYQSLAEPDMEVGRLYEQQNRRRRERPKGKEKARDEGPARDTGPVLSRPVLSRPALFDSSVSVLV